MKLYQFKISPRQYIFLAILMALLWVLVRHRVAQMDERFFQPSVLGIKGLLLYEAGDYGGAAKTYRANFKKIYDTERTASDPAYDALLRGDLKAAKELSEEALKRDPSALGPLLSLGEVFLESKDIDSALSIFKQILQNKTDQFDALLLSSVAYARSGAYGEAISSLNRALRHMKVERRSTSFLQALEVTGELDRLPKGKKPLCLLAHYYRYLRIYDPSNESLAIAYARKAIAAGDEPDNAYLTMGVIYQIQGKRDQALSTFLKAIEINPQNPEALRWAGNLYSDRGDLLNEYKMKKAAYENASGDPYYLNAVDHVLVERLGDYTAALALNTEYLQTRPNDGQALRWVGLIYRELGNYKQSVAYYKRAIHLQPQNAALYQGLGSSLDLLGRNAEAISIYQKALSIDPGQSYSHTSLAYLFSEQHRYQEAIREYQKALRMRDSSMARMNLCRIYYVLAEFESSAACLQQILQQDPDNTLAQHDLAYTLSFFQR
jgi:tetratricopeptide (TPR) repeat protein